jgi:hypothetical protein
MGIDPLLAGQLAALGVGTGFLAGLLGIGSGMVMVPLITFLLAAQGVAAAAAVKAAMRTGAAGALGLAMLARPDSRTLCLFGSGVQAAIQLRFALRALPGLERVFYLSSDGRPREAFEARFAGRCRPVQASARECRGPGR